jgi:glycosyltransferase involved in cell wall biosynthesis
MSSPVLTIFYQFDPWRSTIGGIQTLILLFIKYASSEFKLRLVGITSDPHVSVGKWHTAELQGKEIEFMPLLFIKNDDIRNLIPTTLRYTLALLGHCFASDFMHFHRLEPSLACLNWVGDKTFFVHNDIRQQMAAPGDKKAILWRYFPSAYFALERLLVRQFTQILSCNSESIALYRQQNPTLADRVKSFNNAVDTEVFFPLPSNLRQQRRAEFASKFGLEADTQFILFAGRLHPQKDPLLLVRSIAALNQPDVHLLIAGDGELAAAVQSEIVRLGLSKQITMLGPQSRAQLVHLQQVSHLCVLTSAYEGLPIVVLEALACGTPVVTTRCGETPRLLTSDTGIVCGERTPNEIANALRIVLNQPDRFSSEACVRVVQPYSASAVIQAVYDDMLSRWQPRSISPLPSMY